MVKCGHLWTGDKERGGKGPSARWHFLKFFQHAWQTVPMSDAY